MLSFYTIVLENKNLHEDDRLKAYAFAENERKISKWAKTLNLKKLRELVFIEKGPIKEFLISTLFGNDDQLQLANGMPWFDAKEGLEWTKGLIDFFEENPGGIKNREGVLMDLKNCEQVFKWADENNIRWHFTIKYEEPEQLPDNQDGQDDKK